MAGPEPVVIAAGMMTAIGLSAAETAASVRAGTMRFTETPILDHGFEPIVLAEVLEEGLPEPLETLELASAITARELRMLRLATPPLGECLAAVPRGAPPPGLVLALPETETAQPLDRPGFLAKLWIQFGQRLDRRFSIATHVGRAGGLVAIAQAAEVIRAGQAPWMIAGGVDTYRDLYVLGTLDAEKRVKSAVHLDGFVPGEGAGFVLLASAAAAAAAGRPALARLSRVAQAVEQGHLYGEEPYRGEGLAKAVMQLVQAGVVAAPFAEVWSSMNGESHWAKEWAVAFLRNHAAFTEDHGMNHPADCFGDTGAACGPLMVGLQALGMRDGYRRAPALVYASSDRGARAALAVSAA